MEDLINRIGYIYKITSPNNKIYIGQTINPAERKYCYKKLKFKGQIKLWNSCQAYSWNPADTFEIIDECFRGENGIDLDKLEIHWIIIYDSFYNGLNCNEGGAGNKGHKYTEESKKKISDSLKKGYEDGSILPPMLGQHHSDETKEKLSVVLKDGYATGRLQLTSGAWIDGHETWNKGTKGLQIGWNKGLTGYYTHSKESKEKLSNTLKEKYSKQEHHLKGRTLTEEHKEKLSNKIPHNKGKTMDKFPCVHCGKEADIHNLKRWHNDNCRHKK